MDIRYKDIQIRNAKKEDAATLGTWWRDGKIMAHAGFPNGLPITDKEIIEKISTDSDDTVRRLIIEYMNQPIGESSFRNLNDGSAQIGIKICESNHQEKGLGTIILKLLIASLFDDYGYQKIVLNTNLDNKRAQHVYEKIGFKKIKVNIDAWTDQVGQLQSFIDYELTKDNFVRMSE